MTNAVWPNPDDVREEYVRQEKDLQQEFIAPHCPQQNGLLERVMRALKEQCVRRQRFDSKVRATRLMAGRIALYNQQRQHQEQKNMVPDPAYPQE